MVRNRESRKVKRRKMWEGRKCMFVGVAVTLDMAGTDIPEKVENMFKKKADLCRFQFLLR